MSRKAVMKGIDASRWNIINFRELKENNPDLDFVMLRIGGTEDVPYKDSKFSEYYKEAKEAGFHVGVYYMLPKKVKAGREFLHLLYLMQGVEIDMPLAFDCELQTVADSISNTKNIAMLCEMFEQLGYYVSIYTNPNFFRSNILNISALARFDFWIAAWSNTESEYKGGMWQYSNKGSLIGCQGDIDLDYAFYNYPEIIADKKLNRCKNCVYDCNILQLIAENL